MIRQKEVEYKYLEFSSPDAVYRWLENNASELSSYRNGLEIEEMLIGRKNELIDLGLALFSVNVETRSHLYSNGDIAIKKAVLSNKNFGCEDTIISQLLEEKDIELINVFLKNTEDRLILVDLFKKEGAFIGLDNTYWISLLEMAAYNQILQYPYSSDGPKWGDDIGVLSHATRLYKAAYGLFGLLDANNKNAVLLAHIVQTLPAVQGESPYDSESSLKNLKERLSESEMLSGAIDSKKVVKIFEKWKNPLDISHSEYLYFYENRYGWDPSLDEEYNRVESKGWRVDPYIICRSHLAFSIYDRHTPELKSFKDSDDVAFRIAYYKGRNFNLEPGELIDNWNLFVRKDSEIFLANIVKNSTIYYNEIIREFIGEGLVLSKVSFSDEYEAKLNEYKKNNPSEFKSDLEIRLESQLNEIKSNISFLREEIKFYGEASYKHDKELSTVQFAIVALVLIALLSLWFF